MNLEFTPEEQAFREEVRAFIAENYPKHLADFGMREDMAREDFVAWHKILGQKGWSVPAWPVEYGGTGWTPTQRYIWSEENARVNALMPLPFGVSMVGPVIYTFGSEEQKAKHLPGIRSGEVWWCQGYSEPGAGSDLAALRTAAVEDGDHYIINGSKIWTSTAKQADMIFCLVRTDPSAKKHEGITYITFPMSTPGIEVRPLVDMTGSANFNEVFFTNVRVPKSGVIYQPNKGWQVANATLTHERGMLGDPNATKARFLELVTLMKSESVNGQRLIDNPHLRDRLMKLQSEVYAMQANGLRITTSRLKGEPAGIAGLIVKLNGCDLNHEIARLAIDALGELGILYEEGEHLRADGSWQWRYMYDLGLIIGGGTAQIQKNIIAERGLDMPREPKLAKG